MTRIRTAADGSRRRGRWQHTLLLVAVMAAPVGLAACSGELPEGPTLTRTPSVSLSLPGSSEPSPTETTPTETTPTGASPTETTPAESPTPEETVTQEPESSPTATKTKPPSKATEKKASASTDEGLSTQQWILLLLAGAALLAALVGLILWLSRRSSRRLVREEAIRRGFDSVSSKTRWVLEQGVPSLVNAASPASAQTAWTLLSTNLNDVEREVSSMLPDLEPEVASAAEGLGEAISALRAASGPAVQAMTATPVDAELVRAAQSAVQLRRDELSSAAARFDAARP